MARGYDANQEHKAALAALGRGLARRARSRCELCEQGERSLAPWEVPPAPAEPEEDRCLMICGGCRAGVEGGRVDSDAWRFLEGVVWSELPAVQVTAVRMLRRLAAEGVSWAVDVVDGLYLEGEVQEWADAAT